MIPNNSSTPYYMLRISNLKKKRSLRAALLTFFFQRYVTQTQSSKLSILPVLWSIPVGTNAIYVFVCV